MAYCWFMRMNKKSPNKRSVVKGIQKSQKRKEDQYFECLRHSDKGDKAQSLQTGNGLSSQWGQEQWLARWRGGTEDDEGRLGRAGRVIDLYVSTGNQTAKRLPPRPTLFNCQDFINRLNWALVCQLSPSTDTVRMKINYLLVLVTYLIDIWSWVCHIKIGSGA